MIEVGKYWRFDVHIWWSHSISYAVEEPLIYWSSFQIIIELSLAVSTVPLALKHFQREKKIIMLALRCFKFRDIQIPD